MQAGDELVQKMGDVERKNPYHSDLSDLGELKVRLKGGLRSSKYPDREGREYDGQPLERNYVLLEIEHSQGTETYSFEPDTQRVAEVIRQAPKNTWLVADFAGAKQDAELRLTDLEGNLVVDSRTVEEGAEPVGGAARAGGRPASGGGGATQGGRSAHHAQEAPTAMDLYQSALMSAAFVLSRCMEQLGTVPDEEAAEELGPEYVGYIHVSDFLRMMKELGNSMVIQSDMLGIPLSHLTGEEPGADSAERGDGGGPSGEADLEGRVTGETMERVETLSELVWAQLDEEQREVINNVIDGRVTEGRARAILTELTKLISGDESA